MKTMPATMTTHAAATYSPGGLTGAGGGGGAAAATEVGSVEDSGVSLMSSHTARGSNRRNDIPVTKLL
jgi:hypothetical protein